MTPDPSEPGTGAGGSGNTGVTEAPVAAGGRHHAEGPDSHGSPLPERRSRYQRGTEQRWHLDALERAADVAVSAMPMPLRMLDVGCGQGLLLGELVVRVPYADAYVGVDPLPDVLIAARRQSDLRLSFVRAAAESLPFPGASFDLVLATFSFAHWGDQRAGLAELSRVVTRTGKVVLVDTTNGSAQREGAVHKVKDVTALLAEAGLNLDSTETLHRSALGSPTARAFISSP
jgi:ubiquinone/menaquinone biosynthesis C-methylase UbiE